MENATKLTPHDAEILGYFRKHSPASASDAKKALRKAAAVEYRVAVLAKPEIGLLAEDMDTDLSGTRELHRGLGVYRITPKGAITLDNYNAEKKQHWRELLLKSLWLPIAVSFATALLTTLLTLMLKGLLL